MARAEYIPQTEPLVHGVPRFYDPNLGFRQLLREANYREPIVVPGIARPKGDARGGGTGGGEELLQMGNPALSPPRYDES